MNGAEEISVIVPVYGPCQHLEDLVRALLDGAVQPREIIIAHSGLDNPAERISRLWPSVVVIHQDERLFAGAARNRGAAVAKGELLAFIDADVHPEADWLSRLARAITHHKRRFVVGSVGCATGGGYWGRTNWICEFSELLPWRRGGIQMGGASCSMIVYRHDFHAAGGFTEIHQPGEDTILFLKLAELGLQHWFEPSAKVGHHNIPGFANLARHQYRLGYHSAVVRQKFSIRGSIATQFWPLATLLWLPRLCLVTMRVLEGGLKKFPLAVLHFPALFLSTCFWTAGFLTRVLQSRVIKD